MYVGGERRKTRAFSFTAHLVLVIGTGNNIELTFHVVSGVI